MDQEKNQILKRMWLLSEQEILNDEEREFYNTHLKLIQDYYQENARLWSEKELL